MSAVGDARKRQTETITVKVIVDTDELRHWAGKHADAGRHGVAHVLYKAASDGESLTDQAIREAVDQARAEAGALPPQVERGAECFYGSPRGCLSIRCGSNCRSRFDRMHPCPACLVSEILNLRALVEAWGGDPYALTIPTTADHTAALDAVKAEAAREAGERIAQVIRQEALNAPASITYTADFKDGLRAASQIAASIAHAGRVGSES